MYTAWHLYVTQLATKTGIINVTRGPWNDVRDILCVTFGSCPCRAKALISISHRLNKTRNARALYRLTTSAYNRNEWVTRMVTKTRRISISMQLLCGKIMQKRVIKNKTCDQNYHLGTVLILPMLYLCEKTLTSTTKYGKKHYFSILLKASLFAKGQLMQPSYT